MPHRSGAALLVPSPARIRSTIATIATPPEDLRDLRAFHKAMADTTRLRILRRLSASPANVGELIELVDLSQPLVSWHIRTLKAAGLVETRRIGRQVICTLRPDVLSHYLHEERALLGLAREGVA
jgi:ArsR family transcriptional regulator, zinc-responsive transcriptional repressor